MHDQRLIELRDEANKVIYLGDIEKAVDIINMIKAIGPSPGVSYIASGLLIDLGYINHDASIIEEGVNILKSDIANIIKDHGYAPSAFYNLGNGYSSLYSLKAREERISLLFKKSELDEAIKYYAKALEYDSKDRLLRSRIFVNLGNCYDSLGRSLDALDCYERALKIKPDHGMAYFNKGETLNYFASFSYKHEASLRKEAYLLIRKALEMGVNRGTIPYGNSLLERIEKRFIGKKGFLLKEDNPPWSKQRSWCYPASHASIRWP